MKYTDHFKLKQRSGTCTPQTQKLPGTNQKKNNAGGYSFVIDKWSHLNRFLILGSEGGTYYTSEKKLTKQNAKNVIACIKENGKRAVDTIVEISQAGRAPRNDPALFALALAASVGDVTTRQYAFQQLPKVARIGTFLFTFVEMLKNLRGWSKQVNKGVSNWYESKTAGQLAHQLTKYQQRNGWSHADILKLAHIKTSDEDKGVLYRWAIKGETYLDITGDAPKKDGLKRLWAFERAKRSSSEAETIQLIEKYRLPWECIPTDKRTPKVWEAMLPSLGMTALIRNLGNLSAKGILKSGGWTNLNLVRDRLTNPEILKKARIHPLNILVALNTYARGRGVRGRKTWNVIPDIKDMLNDAFYLSFDNVEPANKRFLLGVDVSGSMGSPELANMTGITPRVGAAAMMMTAYRTEPMALAMGFSHQFTNLGISRKDTLESVIQKTSRLNFGATDCALPMVYAEKNNIEVDVFVVYTDNETWYSGSSSGYGWGRNNRGNGHPVEALRRYRDKTGIGAKLIVCGMTATNFSIADPNDRGMLDVVGFDTATPRILRDFAAGDI